MHQRDDPGVSGATDTISSAVRESRHGCGRELLFGVAQHVELGVTAPKATLAAIGPFSGRSGASVRICWRTALRMLSARPASRCPAGRQQRLDRADCGCLDDVDGALLAGPAIPERACPIAPRVSKHWVRIAQETEKASLPGAFDGADQVLRLVERPGRRRPEPAPHCDRRGRRRRSWTHSLHEPPRRRTGTGSCSATATSARCGTRRWPGAATSAPASSARCARWAAPAGPPARP